MGFENKIIPALAIVGATVLGGSQVYTDLMAAAMPPVPGVTVLPPSGQKIDGVSILPQGPIKVHADTQAVVLRNDAVLGWAFTQNGRAEFNSNQLPSTQNGGVVGTVFLEGQNCVSFLTGRTCRTGPPTGFTYIKDITGPQISIAHSENDKLKKGAQAIQYTVDEQARVSINGVNQGLRGPGSKHNASVLPAAFGPITATFATTDTYGNPSFFEQQIGEYEPIGPLNVKKFHERVDQGKPYVSLDYVYQQAQSDGSFTSTVDLKQQIGVFTFHQDCHQYLPPANPNGERSSLCTWVPIDSRLEATFSARDNDTGLTKTETVTKEHGDTVLPYVLQGLCGTILTAPVITYLAIEGLKRRKMKTKKAKKGSGGSSGTGPKYSDPEVVVVIKPNRALLPTRTGNINPNDGGDDIDPDGPPPYYPYTGVTATETPENPSRTWASTWSSDFDDELPDVVPEEQASNGRKITAQKSATPLVPNDVIDVVAIPVAQAQLTASTAKTLPSRSTVREKVFAR